MRAFPDRPRVVVKPFFYLYICFVLLLLPLNLIMAWLAAAAVHELGHCAALACFGIRVYSVTIGGRGTYIETETMTYRQEFITALAGPLMGCSLLLFLRQFPILAIFATLHSLFNLMPIADSDGGRALRSLLRWAVPEYNVGRICKAVDKCTVALLVFLLLIAGIIFSILPVAMICAAVLLLQTGRRKIPCKHN